MDRISISRNAHFVLNTLGNNRKWTYQELKRATGLSDQELYAAVGWLAHEGTVCFGYDCEECNLSLAVNVYIG